MNVVITERDGVEYATLPRAEFEAMRERLEDMADVAAANEIMGAVADGTEAILPAEFVDRMLAGESPVRLWREHREISQSELARRSGIHRVNLGHIEAGRRGTSVETLKRLAEALDVTMDDLA